MYKKISVVFIAALLAVGTVFLHSCKDDEKADPAADGRAAAAGICACMKVFDNALEGLDPSDEDDYELFMDALDAYDDCSDPLFAKYAAYAESENEAFWNAFETAMDNCELENIDWESYF